MEFTRESLRMKLKLCVLLGAFLLGASSSPAAITLASGGKPRCVIVQQAEASAPEQHAVAELALHLNLITGAKFEVNTNAVEVPKNAIIVGQGSLAMKLFHRER